ncbi:hypothetical protein K493DRAFT_383418 [Basidiobolus meristosporus CBS 931.73]|uniref:TPR-like protein n=1 Tax=Basidiobolus meristosporus CBS 931.73 TaxID=1314790 RepID=A0A1Y1XU34_9FUNG|nr:hypothetical protein K493DRAFT_383418 [Basidiobolus meristosporus CBS 931.73]|eukprot:ORX89195.1 hypothetical protein K493DRAFT_383418 [Basidiobolus meristosporus CBS 931.73]
MFRRGYIALAPDYWGSASVRLTRAHLDRIVRRHQSSLVESLESNLLAKNRENAWSNFNQLLNSGKENGIKASQYSKLLELVVSVPRVSITERARGQKILLSMQRNQVRFTNCTEYASLILFHAKNGRIDLIKRTLAEMKRQGIEPDASIYHYWIKETIPRNFSAGLEVIKYMEACGVKPELPTIEILRKAALEKNELETLTKIEEKFGNLRAQEGTQAYAAQIENYTRALEIKKAEGLFEVMKQAKVSPDSLTYNSMIRMYGRVRDYESVLSLYNAVRAAGLRLTESSYNYTAISLASFSRLDEALKVLEEMAARRLRPDQHCYDLVVRELLTVSRPVDAFNLYRQALDSKTLLSVKTFTRLIHHQLKQRNSTEAMQIYQDMLQQGITPDARVLTVLVEVQSRFGCTDHADFLWNEVRRHKVQMDDYLCNTLLNACIRNSSSESAVEVFEAGRRLGYSFDRSVYRALLQLCLNGNQLDAAKRILSPPTLEPKVDIVTCTMLLRSFADQFDLDGVRMVHRLIDSNNVQLDIIALNTLLDSYGKCGILREAERLFSAHLAPNSYPKLDTISYNTMIRSYTLRNMFAQADDTLESMISAGLLPSTVTFNTLIAGYIRHGDLARAESLVLRMQKLKIPRNTVTFNTMILGYMSDSNIDAASSSYKEMLALGVKPDVQTFDTLIHGCMNHSRFTQARQWFEEMARTDTQPTIETFNTFMNGYLKAYRIDDALRVFDDLYTRLPIAPTVVTYGILMNCWSYAKNHEKVLAMWSKLQSEPNFARWDPTGCISVLLDSCGVNADLDELEKRWSEVNALNVPLSENNYASYCEALVRCRQRNKAVEVLESWHQKNGKISGKTGEVMLKLLSHDKPLAARIKRCLHNDTTEQ